MSNANGEDPNSKNKGDEAAAEDPPKVKPSQSETHSVTVVGPQKIRMGSDEDPREYDRLRLIFKRTLVFGNVIGASLFFIIFIWGLMYGGGYGWSTPGQAINLHIVIMVLFLVYVQGHASLIYRILPNKPKYSVKLAHAGIHATVCVAIGVGLAAAVQSHNLKSQPHFYSLHSWLGITTIGCYYLQFLGGFLSFLLPFAPASYRTAVLPIHRLTGQSLFTFATAATVTGIMLKAIGSLPDYFKLLPSAGVLLNTAGFLVIVFAIIMGNLLSDIRFIRRPRPEGEMLLSQTEGRGGGDPDQSDQTD